MVVALFQIFVYRLIVGEIAVMHQRFVERAEGMAAARMPDAAAGRIALMGQPGMGLEIIQLVIADDVLRIADDFQDHHVPAMGHDKGLFLAQRGVIMRVDLEAVLIDELILGIAPVQGGQACCPR